MSKSRFRNVIGTFLINLAVISYPAVSSNASVIVGPVGVDFCCAPDPGGAGVIALSFNVGVPETVNFGSNGVIAPDDLINYTSYYQLRVFPGFLHFAFINTGTSNTSILPWSYQLTAGSHSFDDLFLVPTMLYPLSTDPTFTQLTHSVSVSGFTNNVLTISGPGFILPGDPVIGDELGPAHWGITYTTIVPSSGVPEPAALALFGLGIVALGAMRRKRVAYTWT